MVCGCCGTKVTVTKGVHALLCAGAEATIGHNHCRDVLLSGVAIGDPGSCTEVPGQVPSHPLWRPADILTRAAVPGVLAALDIGIASPEACDAGEDCLDAMVSKKLVRYREALPQLVSQGISYTPVPVSCFGRRSRALTNVMRFAASRAARVRGVSGHGMLRRWYAALGVEIWRRAAAMVRKCLPPLADSSLALLVGEAG